MVRARQTPHVKLSLNKKNPKRKSSKAHRQRHFKRHFSHSVTPNEKRKGSRRVSARLIKLVQNLSEDNKTLADELIKLQQQSQEHSIDMVHKEQQIESFFQQVRGYEVDVKELQEKLLLKEHELDNLREVENEVKSFRDTISCLSSEKVGLEESLKRARVERHNYVRKVEQLERKIKSFEAHLDHVYGFAFHPEDPRRESSNSNNNNNNNNNNNENNDNE